MKIISVKNVLDYVPNDAILDFDKRCIRKEHDLLQRRFEGMFLCDNMINLYEEIKI